MKKKKETQNEKNMQNIVLKKEFSKDQGNILLKLTRCTIGEKLGVAGHIREKNAVMKEIEGQMFNEKLGTFVTLHLNGALRGCIGTLESAETVKNGIIRNAVNAAFHDPRFPELTADEFNSVQLEVSILSAPMPLEYKDSQDLLSKLQPDIHGVIIKKGGSSATFLPQVWHQLPDREIFLSSLCRKAGLSDREWKKGTLDVMTYTVQYFEE